MPILDELLPAKHHRIDIEPAHEGWSLFNPTIAWNGSLCGIVRSSNYRIVDGRYVMPPEDGKVIRTENIFVRFHDDLRVASARVIQVQPYPQTEYPVTGLEDCRLRHTQTGLGVSATVRNVSPFDGRCRIAIADLDCETATLSRLQVLSGLRAQEHEKNWMPFMGDRGGWLYAANFNGYLVTVDEDTSVSGAWQVVQRQRSPEVAKPFRGGSQFVPFRGGWLGVTHEVFSVAGRRVYEHRFVWLDAGLTVSRISPLLAFRESDSIEFAAGIVAQGDRVIVSYGVRDAEAWLCEMAADGLNDILQPVDRDGVRAA